LYACCMPAVCLLYTCCMPVVCLLYACCMPVVCLLYACCAKHDTKSDASQVSAITGFSILPSRRIARAVDDLPARKIAYDYDCLE
jgi:hypothetical protein